MSDSITNMKRFLLPLIFFALYVANILVAKVQMLMGIALPTHIGDVGEFLLLFATSITFVFVSLNAEKKTTAINEEAPQQEG